MEPYADVCCVLEVNVHCDACKMKMLEVLRSISGVYSVSIDAEAGTAKVSGEVDPNKLMAALARPGPSSKHAKVAWVKLKHPALNRTNSYDNEYGDDRGYGLYGYNSGYTPYGYEPLEEPTCGYRRRGYQNHYPVRRAVPEYPWYGGHNDYYRQPGPFSPARFH